MVDEMRVRATALFGPLSTRKSDFFRDLAAAEYMQLAEAYAARMISLADGRVVSDVPNAKAVASRGDA